MKGSRIIAFAALLAVLAGIVGIIVCLQPSQSAPDKVISNYVSAINAVKVEKMNKYTFASVASDALGGLLGGQVDDLLDSGNATDIYGALQCSTFSTSGLPADLTKVTSVKLVGCVDGETESYMGLTGMSVTAVLQIDYEDANGDAQTLNTTEYVGLILYKNKYYIVS